MVSKMEEPVKMDRQGRLVLPARIRHSLGLEEGGRLHIRLDGPRVIIEPAHEEIEKNVDEWKETTLRLKSRAFTEDVEEGWKWMSREYARRKLGL